MPLEYRANWTAGITGPGVTVVHGRDTFLATPDEAAQELADRLRAFFQACTTLFPAGVTIAFDSEAVMLNTTTGVLEEVYPVDPPASVTGTASSGSYARPTGMRVDWLTAAVVAGKRLRGRTYLVPTSMGVFDATGTPIAGNVTILQNAANAYFDSPDNVAPSVWSRTHGIAADISGASVPDEAAILSSRRD